MVHLVAVAIQSVVSTRCSRRELLLENLALRQQLAAVVQKVRPHPGGRSCLLGGPSARLVALGRSPRRREARDHREVASGRVPPFLAATLPSREEQRPTRGGGRTTRPHPPDGQ